MRRDWFLGLGAISTLAMLVGIDLLITSMADRGRAASLVVVKRMRRRGVEPRGARSGR